MFCGSHHNHNVTNPLKAETHTRYKVCNIRTKKDKYILYIP